MSLLVFQRCFRLSKWHVLQLSDLLNTGMICNRCGKRFSSQASVLNHQAQLSSRCWKIYSLLLDQQQPNNKDCVQPSPSVSPPPPLEAEIGSNSPPLTPPLGADFDIDIDDNHQVPLPFFTDFFHGSSNIFGKGETYMDLYNEDAYADKRRANLHYPFACQPEWEVASFLLKSDLSRGAIDEFLKLQLVSAEQ